jgi:hypothetical protein
MPTEITVIARLEMHLPGGYSRVLLQLPGGRGLAGGDIHWEIPTESIPFHLRRIGSRFLVTSHGLTGKAEAETMSGDEIRASIWVTVQEIQPK